MSWKTRARIIVIVIILAILIGILQGIPDTFDALGAVLGI